jgi:hypothetical protein
MSSLTKLALGMMGRLRPKPAQGEASKQIALPPPQREGGIPLMEAISKRRSEREFACTELPLPMLSTLLWTAYGVNRPDGGRTAPSALNAQEVDIYVALPSGAYIYDAGENLLQLIAASDLRRVTGYQDFVDEAPLDLVFVADYSRMKLVPVSQRQQRAGYRYSRMDRPRGDCRCFGAEPRSAGAPIANRGLSKRLSFAPRRLV